MIISNWGHYPSVNASVRSFKSAADLKTILPAIRPVIARGLGRCYGDSSLSENILSTTRYNKITSLNIQNGIIVCQSGATLKEILEIIVPKGWFLPVTPGTKFVTIGGAVSADVHGKNHHRVGSFSEFILNLDLMLSDGSVISCSREDNSEYFHAACGGMGLAGIILTVSLKLIKISTAYIRQKTVKSKDLAETMELFDRYEAHTYSVAWIDCLSGGASMGKGILMLGEHAEPDEIRKGEHKENPFLLNKRKSIEIPFNFPGFILNYHSARLFNYFYYHKKMEVDAIIGLDSFFYPLDLFLEWNRVYGARGLVQYQFVLPREFSKKGTMEILKKIYDRRRGCFLAVLKLMGPENRNRLSFPMEGFTLALDFPVTPELFNFLDELDKIVQYHGGRLYLAKDARMSKEMFMKSYLKSSEFIQIRNLLDKDKRFSSLQSRRIGLSQ